MLRQPVTLSLDTLTTVWRRENLGEPHNVLVSVPAWRDEDAEREALGRAVAELRGRGLLMGRDLHPDLRATVELLARPSMEYYGWIATTTNAKGDPVDIGVLVAATGQDAVQIVRDHDIVHLSPARSEGVAEALVGHLPPVSAARGRSMNLPEAQMRRLLSDRAQVTPGGGAPPLPAEAFDVFGRASMAEDARDLVTAMELARTGGGELYVAARGRGGERRRCANPIVYVDTVQGRWMTQLSEGPPGQRWITSAPASRQLLLSRLNELRSDVLR